MLLRRPRYDEARRVMKDNITTTWNVLNRQRKNKRNLEINDTLLLTPYTYGNSNIISRKEDICIKHRCFLPLADTSVRLITLLSYVKVSTSAASTRPILSSDWLTARYQFTSQPPP